MRNELTKDFISRQRNNRWSFTEQIDYLEKFWAYANQEVPGLPEPHSCCSDGDSYAICWEVNGKTFWADVFDYCFLWMYTDETGEVTAWDEVDVDSPSIPSSVAMEYLRKLLQ